MKNKNLIKKQLQRIGVLLIASFIVSQVTAQELKPELLKYDAFEAIKAGKRVVGK